MNQTVYDAPDEAATDALGAALATLLPRPACVALRGTLGSGKTRLVQALAAALGIDRALVSSPTFVLLHEYPGSTPLYHFDAYRLRDSEEFWNLGAEDYLADRDAVTIIEWAERIPRCLPAQRLEIDIEVTGPTQRQFRITALGPDYRSVAERLRAWSDRPER
ncbi:MAG TPA: tRNA (adenosine(37)-N6)-threonylcarbamoyltransferase complex ATPase subunit type 1 TsaE [Pirellulales bacterium]|nr:tRNA (adenosine(37)-N6)-threonylcarbamoyltransferase complex ATPase subunit type 1 TsaE [Pirellulales bacterium]